MRGGRLDILLVDDEKHDVFFVQKAAAEADAKHTVHAVHDAEEAIRYLRGEAEYADRKQFPLPNVILTDLKMPGMGGMGFLRWLRKHPNCSIIPTIVYSSSSLESDVQDAYRAGANSYIAKPTELTELVKILGAIYDYWSRCECPPKPHGC